MPDNDNATKQDLREMEERIKALVQPLETQVLMLGVSLAEARMFAWRTGRVPEPRHRKGRAVDHGVCPAYAYSSEVITELDGPGDGPLRTDHHENRLLLFSVALITLFFPSLSLSNRGGER